MIDLEKLELSPPWGQPVCGLYCHHRQRHYDPAQRGRLRHIAEVALRGEGAVGLRRRMVARG